MGDEEALAIYDGVVTLADDQVPVIVELDGDHVRMSASGTEIGNWAAHECRINHLGNATYAITAENETLEFVPSQPSLFAAALNGGVEAPTTVPQHPGADTGTVPGPQGGIDEAPPPRPLTMGLFYALCLTTAVLAVWSLITIIF